MLPTGGLQIVVLRMDHFDSPPGDRTFKGDESRRIGVYHVACLSLKCYFKVISSTTNCVEINAVD